MIYGCIAILCKKQTSKRKAKTYFSDFSTEKKIGFHHFHFSLCDENKNIYVKFIHSSPDISSVSHLTSERKVIKEK